MISEKIGKLLKENTKTKLIKMGLALVLSNVFFFMLFSGDSEVTQDLASSIPEGWVEVQLEAQMLTPFQNGKKILLVQRNQRRKMEGVLKEQATETPGAIVVLVKETEAHTLFQFERWEVLPYLKKLTFASHVKEASHEIRY